MSTPSRQLEILREDADRFADQLSCSTTRDEALNVAIQAAETSLKALKLVTDPSDKAEHSTKARQLMREAEAIKHSTDWRGAAQRASASVRLQSSCNAATKVRVLQEPANSRKLSSKERVIKLRAGFLNGNAFPEWEAVPPPSEFELKEDGKLFFDETSELPLSDFQHDVLDDWKRPADALPPPFWFSNGRGELGPIMAARGEIDLVQDAATDCSVVASLCAGVARSKKGHPEMIYNFLYPYDVDQRRPGISENGRYVVCLNFNGCCRKVVIDDRIPTSTTSRVIHVVDRNNPGLLWPALLEKAYLKVRGGYDFPGSNSATDLWILTGWIPEQVFLQDDVEIDSLWRRISSAFSYGDVLITMGTGKMSSDTEKAIGLAGEHDYAVLDLREVDGQRLMLIKNPWVEGTSWRGRFNAQPKTGHEGVQTVESIIQSADDADLVNSPRDLLNGHDQLTPGTFWMDMDNVLQHFDSIYLNWNTGLFRFRQDIHFEWDLSEPSDGDAKKMRGPHASLQHTPQFTITASGGDAIWILLWRHFHNSVPETATAEDVESGRYFIDLNGYVNIAVFLTNGKRVTLPEKHLQKGWFIDSPQTLLKLEDVRAGQTYTIVPLEQNLPSMKQSFTISAFSRSMITVAEAPCRFPYVEQVIGVWNKDTAGGNAQHATYYDNPQFTIAVPQSMSISILVEACNPELYVHVKLLHSNGQRVFRIRNRDIIVDSKEYRPGCCLATYEDLAPGKYTILCSTFEPQQLSDFSVRIESSQPTRTQLLPREGAGRIRTRLSTISFQKGIARVAAPLVPHRLINIYAIARLAGQQPNTRLEPIRSNSSHIRLGVEYDRGPHRQVLTASNQGEYSDSSCAVRTEAIDLSPDFRKDGHQECWIVLDSMYVNSEVDEEKFEVELFVDQPNAVDVGAWRALDE